MRTLTVTYNLLAWSVYSPILNGVSFEEIFVVVALLTSLRIVLAILAKYSFDINNWMWNRLDEEGYLSVLQDITHLQGCNCIRVSTRYIKLSNLHGNGARNATMLHEFWNINRTFQYCCSFHNQIFMLGNKVTKKGGKMFNIHDKVTSNRLALAYCNTSTCCYEI